MNSRVSWSVDGIDPSVRERAEAAARRAGMSLNDWLNSTLGDTSPPNFRASYDQRPQHVPSQGPSQESREVADIHQRLDAITQQIERISKPAPRQDVSRQDSSRPDVSREQGVARQLNDAISRLDARLSQISRPQRQPAQPQAPRPTPAETRQRQADAVERAAAQVYRGSPPLSPASFDVAVAEITARQSELEGFAPRQMPPRAAPPLAPTAPCAPMAPAAPAYAPPPPQPGPDFSALERHLLKITSQIESLQRPDNTEQAINAFRSELAEIRAAITEAMPRRAIESIENEIRSLHRRIDETRSNGTDGQVLAGIERALSDIKQVLRTLTPAEQLTGYDEAIRNLGAKLDLILRANDDPSTVQQLEGAIAALRAIVSNVASNEALARLSEDVQLLSSKVDQITRASGHGDSFAVLEQRIAALTAALETRERPQPSESTEHLEAAIRALSDRFDRMQVGNDSASTFAHLEQRVSYLLERIEAAADPRNGNLSRVEDGLHDILRHLERQQATYAALAESRSSAPPPDSGMVDLVKRELSDIRFSQAETNRHTQDSLEAVHSALGHVVDRLSMIEGDLRAVRTAPPPPAPQPMSMPMAAPMEQAPMAREPRPQPPAQPPKYDPKPELPNPAAAQAPPAAFVAAPREFHAATPAAPPPVPAAPPVPPRAISEILEPHTARAALAPELPPDHPLEPGTRPGGRLATPSERIAASEDAISGIAAAPKEPVSSSSFIAAARRAAQAAAAQPPEKPARGAKAAIARAKEKGQEGGSTITSKIRSLLVGASVVVIVLGTFKMAMNLLEGGSSSPTPQAMQNIPSEPAPQPAPPPVETKPAAPEQITPSMTSPTPIGRQSQNNAAPAPLPGSGSSASVEIPQAPAAAMPPASSDVTGALSGTSRAKLGVVQVPPSEKLPEGIGGPALRSAAMKGDATAAYEIGVRFAEGKGVATNYDEAAKWYDRAAQAGVVPAIFRLGTLYEKGLGVKKDADIARRYYTQAAERGNAKAMHNLAVLDADGGGRGANYKSAAQWFRKAADRGVADSQFNLGILYARGIGVEQNLAESYKWFNLAAAQGDADAAGKRDDVAKRLDPQSLAAAKLAIQTFSAEPQPDDAVNVATPNGGWDSAPQASAKPAPKQVATKRSASAAH
ncbi:MULTISPECIES: tetratricopeptide repeat protein [unclassified Bradyrhizobium]|uniref:tetratricopeptide repeat protein n=1 Tax=unclassified Bradyrhizobium TaxID=2631580 RepID=UPI001CD258EC|nr:MULTISPECIES: tetratricopeptide repeat protein [unclassified Bradyrhizobium]MCA1427733.1 SEL1-like repeat protein [Bradyrhizobium sp. NBAIM16]MCA1506529.1 SEL1-like repeat protein [Bradyrhizobium sp. NBAIM02]